MRDTTGGRLSGVRRDERGLALLEFSILLPLVIVLIFGIIDFGTVFGQQIDLRQGVREAGRAFSKGDVGSDASCPLFGATGSANVQKLMCLAKDRTGLDPERTRVKVIFPESTTPGAVESGDSVVVCAAYELQSISGVFGPLLDGRAARAKVEFKVEEPTGAPESEGEETPLDGSDWSFCTGGPTS